MLAPRLRGDSSATGPIVRPIPRRNSSIALLLTIALGVALLPPAWGQPEPSAENTPHQKRSSQRKGESPDDRGGETVRIVIPTREGFVHWRDIVREVTQARGYSPDAIIDWVPDRRTRLGTLSGRITLAALDRALRPHVQCHWDAQSSELSLTIGRVALLETQRRFKMRLRDALTRKPSRRRDGLQPDPGWETTPPEAGLVIFVHGYQGTPTKLSGILDDVRAANLPAAVFTYRNDQAISTSARELSEALKSVGTRSPDRRITLLTHSMGGLVARYAIEAPDLDPGNVTRLVMVAPPNGGSKLAHFGFALEAWEHTTKSRGFTKRFYASIEDGLGEAARDLRPGSVFLRRLNSQPRNSSVHYTIFLGTSAPLSERQLETLRGRIMKSSENRFVRFLGPKLETYLEDLDELVQGRGDGAVSVERGKLRGVEDTVVLEFDHVGVWRHDDRPGSRTLRREILNRVRKPPAPERVRADPE